MDISSLYPSRNPVGASAIRAVFHAYAARLAEKGKSLITFLDLRMETLIAAWIGVIAMIAVVKVAAAPLPPRDLAHAMVMTVPYLLVALAPIAGYRIASGSFPRGLLSAQPSVRLCRYGTWQRLDELKARENPWFGPGGFMASLILGILLNIPFRSLEFLLTVPAVGAGAPSWVHEIQLMMTLDVIVMNFFYMVCFVLALRSIPLFPRMMIFAWVLDIAMQLFMASRITAAPGLPTEVASALFALLEGNIQKVLISVFVWLPYLILSDRVNVTFRRRVRT